MINDDFTPYEILAADGPAVVYRAARRDGLDTPACFRLLRSMFSLSLAEAKEVMVIVDTGADSLNSHQARIAEALDTAG